MGCSAATAALETAKDTGAGIFSAVSQTIVGYPFNTVKVRMQVASQGTFQGPVHCALQLLKHEGVLGMYKGMLPMMLGQQLTNVTLFATYQRARRTLDPNYSYVGGGGGGGQARWAVPVSGCLAGIANSFILCPVELVAVRLQVQNMAVGARAGQLQTSRRVYYKGPWDCFRHIIVEDGWSRVFTGLRPTMAREAVGVSCWFSAYETARWGFMQRNDGASPVGWEVALCGTAGGVSFWSVAYPFDTAKSRLQTQSSSPTAASRGHYTGVVDCISRVSKEEGVAALYRGYSTAVVRAGFVGAAVFYSYEVARAALG